MEQTAGRKGAVFGGVRQCSAAHPSIAPAVEGGIRANLVCKRSPVVTALLGADSHSTDDNTVDGNLEFRANYTRRAGDPAVRHRSSGPLFSNSEYQIVYSQVDSRMAFAHGSAQHMLWGRNMAVCAAQDPAIAPPTD